jgi:hypothetical protein
VVEEAGVPPKAMWAGARVAEWVRLDLSPMRRGFAPSLVNYKKGCAHYINMW